MPFLHTYLVDGVGNYITDEGQRIILSSYEYGTTGFDWQRVASSTKKPPFIRSFNIQKFDNGDTWLLKVNQQMLIGLYPSQDAAIQVLHGLFIRCNASREGAEAAMSKQLSQGTSTIDEALNSLVMNRTGEDALTFILSDIDMGDVTTAGVIGVQTSLDGITWDVPGFTAGVDGTVDPLEVVDSNGYLEINENTYYRGVFYDLINPGNYNIITQTGTQLKDDEAPSGILSVLIRNLAGDGAPEAVYDGSGYVGAAYATPEWTTEDWPEGVSPSYTYSWAYQLDGGALTSVGGSGSTLDLSLVPYGATLKCGAVATAYVNGKIVDSASPAPMVTVAVSEEIPVSFVTNPGADTTDPQVPASVATTAFTAAGTAPITTTYVWKRGSAAIAGATTSSYTTQPADVGSVLTCIVTIDNAFGDPDSRTVSFGTVQAAAVSLDVVDIKLFPGISGSGNTAQPVGQEVSSPEPNTQYYAFAYDGNGVLIQADVTWHEGQGVAATFTGTPAPSHVDPEDGTVLSVTDVGMAGDPAPTVS